MFCVKAYESILGVNTKNLEKINKNKLVNIKTLLQSTEFWLTSKKKKIKTNCGLYLYFFNSLFYKQN